MEVVKIRRVGNSNVVTLPRALESNGFGPGTFVMVDERDGEIVLRPVVTLREAARQIARQIVEEDREALEILAEYDRSGKTSAPIASSFGDSPQCG